MNLLTNKYLIPLLFPFSLGYSLLTKIRAYLYKKRILPSWNPSVFCISVGNISLGGTGKTSLCIWILNWLKSIGYNPVLLTRGYKANPPFLPFLVNEQSDVYESGDEPLMVVLKCKHIPVVVDPDRVRAGRWILERFRPDVFVLDDGFQHFRIKRNLDLVLLSRRDLDKMGDFVLPLGRRREGWSSLKRASVFLMNVYPEQFVRIKKKLKKICLYFGLPLFTFYLEVTSLIEISSWKEVPLDRAKDIRYLLISGLADPLKFEGTVKKYLKGTLIKHFKFPDHYSFSYRDWGNIKKEAGRLGCDAVVCSLKDGVKLRKFADKSLYGVNFKVQFGPFLDSDSEFSMWLKRKLTPP